MSSSVLGLQCILKNQKLFLDGFKGKNEGVQECAMFYREVELQHEELASQRKVIFDKNKSMKA